MIHMTFAPGGKVTVTPHGYAGQQCRAATSPYLAKLAGEVESDVPTAEVTISEPVAVTEPEPQKLMQ